MSQKPCDILRPVAEKPYQVYFSNTLQIADVLEWALQQSGCADVQISTFSTSEEFLRRIVRLKNQGFIRRCALFTDIRGARKTLAIYNFIKSTFDDVYLCENHSKVILINGNSLKIAIITSQNQTRGNRYECGVICSTEEIFAYLTDSFFELIKISRPLNELIDRTN